VSGDRNLELLRRFHDHLWVRKDLEAALECASPQLQIDWSASIAPYSGTYDGPQGLGEFSRAFWDAWDEFNPEIDEFVECGPESVITVYRVSARGRKSGIEVASGGAVIWTLRDGTILRGQLFQTKEDALKAIE
jgi:ketosteroid isomerase-like protein